MIRIFLLLMMLASHVMASDTRRGSNQFEHFRDCDGCSEMIVLPSGKYMMGATEEEFRGQEKKYQFMYANETPRHAVQVRSFALARFHVTKKQFAAFAKETGFKGRGCRTFKGTGWAFDPEANWQNRGFPQTDNDPVVCVSWDDAQIFVAWLNTKLTGTSAHRYRLPTEEEWEYAARAGTATPMYWGVSRLQQCRYENVRDEAAKMLDPDVPVAPCNDSFVWTSPVGFFRPNPWGLDDMLGNASQWISDCSQSGYEPPVVSPAWPLSECRARVLRGGSWASIPFSVRAASRAGSRPVSRNATDGFRLAADL